MLNEQKLRKYYLFNARISIPSISSQLAAAVLCFTCRIIGIDTMYSQTSSDAFISLAASVPLCCPSHWAGCIRSHAAQHENTLHPSYSRLLHNHLPTLCLRTWCTETHDQPAHKHTHAAPTPITIAIHCLSLKPHCQQFSGSIAPIYRESSNNCSSFPLLCCSICCRWVCKSLNKRNWTEAFLRGSAAL